MNPFWVNGLMKEARKGRLSIATVVDKVTQDAQEHREVFDAELKDFVRQRVNKSGSTTSSHALPLIWFLLRRYNPRATLHVAVLACFLIIFRIGNNMLFTQLMAVLADDPDSLIFSRVMPNKWMSVGLFSVSCLVSAWLGYMVDLSSQSLGNFCRLQLIWSVQSATLRSNQSAVSPFSASEIGSLAGIDGMAVRWCIGSIINVIAIPIEFGVLLWLATTQVGVGPAFYSTLVLVAFMVLRMALVKVAARRQKEAREIVSARFGVLNEGISSNSVVKLMNTFPMMMGNLIALRKDEQGKLLWQALSNALSLLMQVALAPLMAYVAMITQHVSQGVTASAIMTVLGYYRTMAAYDTFKITGAIQTLAMASVSANKYMLFFAASIDAEGTVGADDMPHNPKLSADACDRNEKDPEVLADISGASFSWQIDTKPVLHDFTATLPRGKLIGVAGPIGGGKSSMLLALLGELRRSSGTVVRHSDWQSPVAFSPQRSWLESGTMRHNICFAGDEIPGAGADWLQLVVDGCGLTTDIAGFPLGLEHDIGEAGSSLSGGQKARVALARAVYARAAITLLDDPFCALDPGLAEQVFQRVLGAGGLLRGPGRSIVLVTSNPSFLERCDCVLVIQGGSITGSGTPDEMAAQGLLSMQPPKDGTATATALPQVSDEKKVAAISRKIAFKKQTSMMLEFCQGMNTEALAADDAGQPLGLLLEYENDEQYYAEKSNLTEVEYDHRGDDDDAKSEALESKEDQIISGIPVRKRGMFSAVLAAMGWWRLLLGGSMIVAAQGAVYAWQFLLNEWLGDSAGLNKSLALTSRLMIIPMAAFSLGGALIHYLGFLTGSTRLQARCSASVLQAPYVFFSANPASKIQGHISQDSQLVEVPLSATMGGMWLLCSQLVGSIVISCISLPALIVLFVPLAVIYYFIQRAYSRAVVPLSNLEAASRGPLNSTVGATLSGLPVVRAFKCDARMQDMMRSALLANGAVSTLNISAAGWLSFIANVCIYGSISITVSWLLTATLTPGPDSLGPIVLSNIISLSGVIGSSAVLLSNVETSLTAMQRLVMYSELPSEEEIVRHPPKDLDDGDSKPIGGQGDDDGDSMPIDALVKIEAAIEPAASKRPFKVVGSILEPPKDWPAVGGIEYREAYASYTWEALPALKGVNISIKPGSSCALVGRSGSGKSTAFLALTGMIPITSGAIEIDGLDVGRVALEKLREKLAVVPQDPVLFAGGLRPNLDPYSRRSDAVIWDALRIVGLHEAVTDAGGLELDPVKAGLSQGQRQLLCLARALLRDATVLLLDEANASVDEETEIKMAVTVNQFARGEVSVTGVPRKRTVVEVAHRLRNVLEMDQVVVLSGGSILEKGNPKELAETGGDFASMLHAQHLA